MGPVVLMFVSSVFLESVEDAFAVSSDSCLSDVDDWCFVAVCGVIGAEEEVDA